MVLSRVYYDLFAHESDIFSGTGANGEHSINREIRLEMDNGQNLFVSWADKPVQFSVATQDRSFFLPGDTVTLDASDHPLWRPLVGCPITVASAAENDQALRIQSESSTVYLQTRENDQWESDVITVSATLPTYVPHPWLTTLAGTDQP